MADISNQELVNLHRYPIDQPDSIEYKELITACRDSLDKTALCLLPGFIHQSAVDTLTREVEDRLPLTIRQEHSRTAYSWMKNDGFPKDHPRSTLNRSHLGYLLAPHFDQQSLVKQLFAQDRLTDFVRDALGVNTLFRSDCPTLSLMVNVMQPGDEVAWHFDTNDGVISLMLRPAAEGGEYEYAPYIRSESDENYPEVKKLFDGKSENVITPAIDAGTFVLFKGRRSCHRVSRVGNSSSPRLNLLFSYDEKPGMVFPEKTCEAYLHPDKQPFRGA